MGSVLLTALSPRTIEMRFDALVLQEQRHLKWRTLDPLENLLMVLCGICITGFSVVVFADVITRWCGRRKP